jgi:hypothetical protein
VEDLLMHSQSLNTGILDELAEPQTVPAKGANGARANGVTEESDLDDLLNYKHVPPRRIVTISVQYRHIGRGRPLPYPVEDDEE